VSVKNTNLPRLVCRSSIFEEPRRNVLKQ
jgi:hypothetical protein